MSQKAPSKEHVKAMQRGRELSRAVDAYLKVVERPSPGAGS
ncbi:MAG: hypothetical protein U5R31_16980 [Acidimicrobiia bacterium]|nr:hypothetical protein [Acidimicrobiia bacterium]